mgnify:CR=1 FL=1
MRKTSRNTKEAFLWIVGILKNNDVPFRISGGLAARLYGTKRKLADIDLEIKKKDFNKILAEIIIYAKFQAFLLKIFIIIRCFKS